MRLKYVCLARLFAERVCMYHPSGCGGSSFVLTKAYKIVDVVVTYEIGRGGGGHKSRGALIFGCFLP